MAGVPPLDQVSLAVGAGEVYALLGLNGAGKSSLVRCLLGAQRPASGRCRLLGREVWRERTEVLSEVGVVPEEPDAPRAMTAAELSRFCSRLYPRWDAAGFDERLRRFGVSRRAAAPRGRSRGVSRRSKPTSPCPGRTRPRGSSNGPAAGSSGSTPPRDGSGCWRPRRRSRPGG